MKNKKLITAVIFTIIALFATCYSLQKYNDENDFIVTVHDKTIEINGYKGTKTDVNIPPRIGKLPVTAIGRRAFRPSSQNTPIFLNVKIPEGVTVIGKEAFLGNRQREIIIPNTVVSIGDYAFAENLLIRLEIPNSVKHIGDGAFRNNQINHVTIPNTVIEIGNDGAFAHNKITEIVFPDRITKISRSMFADNELTSIKIPETVITIGEHAFRNNRLTEIIIPKSVISIGRGAFSYWETTYWGTRTGEYDDRNNITKVTIGDNVELYLDKINSEDTIRRFDYFYNNAVRKRGGTYIYSDHHWKPEDKNIPVYEFYPVKGWKSPDIKFLLDMPDMEEVTLYDNDLLTDITPLSELTKIKTLKIEKCPNIESIKPLSSLVKLESLYIMHNNNYDYRDLAPLQRLEDLTIVGGYSYSSGEIDLASIGQLHYVKFLNINLYTTKNINELKNLTNLETLRIATDLDLSWAANLRNLTELELYSSSVKDLSPLANLPNLVKIDFSYSHIKDITPLLRSNSLKHVRVFEHGVEGGISDNIRSMFDRKGIELDIFHGDH